MQQDKWCRGGVTLGQLSKCVDKVVEISFFVFSICMKHLWPMVCILFLFPLCRMQYWVGIGVDDFAPLNCCMKNGDDDKI